MIADLDTLLTALYVELTDRIIPARGGAGYLRAKAAQHRDQHRERDLPADPDGRGEHVQEQPDRVPTDREHARP